MIGMRGAAKFGWIVLLCALVCPTQARMKQVDPGEVPTLAPEEGYVLMAVDTDVDLNNLRLNRAGREFGSGAMHSVKAGISYRLFVAPAGDYQWTQVDLMSTLRMTLRDDPEFKFKTTAGTITYAGDLLFRPKTIWQADVGMVNRGLAAIDWMERTHPALMARYRFTYSGHYPDPFPAFYRDVQAQHPGAKTPDQIKLRTPPAPGKLPFAIKTLWREDRILNTELNPRGDLLAVQIRENDEDWQIELVDMRVNTRLRISKSAARFDRVLWADDDVLLVSSAPPVGARVWRAIRFETGADGKRTSTVIKLPDGGDIVDPLPHDPDHVLYASWTQEGALLVHRLPIDSQKSVNRTYLTRGSRLNVGVKDDVQWFTDGEGHLSLCVIKRDDDYVLMRRDGAVFSDVMVLSDREDFDPVGVSYDGRELYAITDEDRTQRDLVAYDLTQRKVIRTLFSKPDVDVAGAIFDAHRVPVGVTYLQGGRRVNEYLDDADNRLERSLQAAFPGRNIAIADRSVDGKQIVLWVDAGDKPPQLYHLDRDRMHADLIDEDMPWLTDLTFAPTELVSFKGADGYTMDAFLTLPSGAGKRPLIVFPHGGPIGVADTLAFDREVQFIASLGYAVLRVNYRGSSGYGRAFREAGYHAYGTAIEDDIDAAIRTVLVKYPLDKSRMCTVGSSYGGYSALVLAIRWPGRFRCAVSISGVSDRTLFFTASDSGRNEKARRLMERIIGDPNKQLDAMEKTSPLYRYEDIRVPVMLVHGREDRRVDYEHTRRLLRLLDIAGRTPVGVVFDKEGHGFKNADNLEALWGGVAGFLRQNLDADAAKSQATNTANTVPQ